MRLNGGRQEYRTVGHPPACESLLPFFAKGGAEKKCNLLLIKSS